MVADDGEEDKDTEPVDERHEHLVHVLEHGVKVGMEVGVGAACCLLIIVAIGGGGLLRRERCEQPTFSGAVCWSSGSDNEDSGWWLEWNRGGRCARRSQTEGHAFPCLPPCSSFPRPTKKRGGSAPPLGLARRCCYLPQQA